MDDSVANDRALFEFVRLHEQQRDRAWSDALRAVTPKCPACKGSQATEDIYSCCLTGDAFPVPTQPSEVAEWASRMRKHWQMELEEIPNEGS